jgi:hypothetical protein
MGRSPTGRRRNGLLHPLRPEATEYLLESAGYWVI